MSRAVNERVVAEQVAFYEVMLRTPSGVETILLRRGDLDRYQADPDAFAAERFGVSKADYREWIAHEGVAYCGARAATGRMCRGMLSGVLSDVREWKRLHRSFYCKSHGGEDERG